MAVAVSRKGVVAVMEYIALYDLISPNSGNCVMILNVDCVDDLCEEPQARVNQPGAPFISKPSHRPDSLIRHM